MGEQPKMQRVIRKGLRRGEGDYWSGSKWVASRRNAKRFGSNQETCAEQLEDCVDVRAVRIVPRGMRSRDVDRRNWASAMFFEVMRENERGIEGFEARGLYESIQNSWSLRMMP